MPDSLLDDNPTSSLPNHSEQSLPQASLPQAQTSAQGHSNSGVNSTSDKDIAGVDETDDELLLSPRKGRRTRTTFNSKRSASPALRDDYSSRSDSPSERREFKRVKRDLERPIGVDINSINADAPSRAPTHTRNHSDPNFGKGWRSTRKRAATASASVKPLSLGNEDSPLPLCAPSGKERARSVPLFSTTSVVPHVDLNNPPPSPGKRRLRSRSPSKEPELKLRIVSGPATVTRLDPIPDEGTPSMDVDTVAAKDNASQLLPKVTSIEVPQIAVTGICSPPGPASLLSVVEPIPNPVIPINIVESPSTPVHLSNLSSPMSPLTPLPETPHPSKFKSNAEERYTGATGWNTNPDEELEHNLKSDTKSSLLFDPQNTVATPGHSRLPRLSSIVNLATAANGHQKPPPVADPMATDLQAEDPKGPATTTKAPAKRDAFALMMESRSKVVDNPSKKGKGRVMVGSSKVATSSSSSTTMHVASSSSSKSLKAKTIGKGVETEKPKATIKARMRPREQSKAKPPNPVAIKVIETEADEERTHSLSHQSDSSTPMPVKSPSSLHTEISMPAPTENVVDESSKSEAASLSSIQDTSSLPIQSNSSPDLSTEPKGTNSTQTQPDIEAPTAIQVEPSALDHSANLITEDKPNSKSASSKASIGKKKTTTVIAPGGRVTRSLSLKRKEKEPQGTSKAAITSSLARQPSLSRTVPVHKRKSVGVTSNKMPFNSEVSTSSLSDLPTDTDERVKLPPGSPMQLNSPVASDYKLQDMQSTSSKSLDQGTAKLTHVATLSKHQPSSKLTFSPSPRKLIRSSSLSAARPKDLQRSSTMITTSKSAGGPSSLSTLANALEKLRMPPPARPNTSMGFNRNLVDDDDDRNLESRLQSKDDAFLERCTAEKNVAEKVKPGEAGSLGPEKTDGVRSIKASFVDPPPNASTSAYKAQYQVQRPISTFLMGGSKQIGQPSSGMGANVRNIRLGGNTNIKPRIFGLKGGAFSKPVQRASKKTSLPSVMASPIKGADTGDATATSFDNDYEDNSADKRAGSPSNGAENGPGIPPLLDSAAIPMQDMDKGKGKEVDGLADAWKKNASRRASMASQALSQSLNTLPSSNSNVVGLMGPPATPSGRMTMRSSSSSYPSSPSTGIVNKAPRSGMGSSTRSAMGAKMAPGALGKIKGGVGGHVSSNKRTSEEGPDTPAIEALKILNDCVIFVDVRTDDGDEAGSLFVEMLEGVGAKISSRVGQKCTHIVYKNGLGSTSSRYRMLRDPKPLVIGIAWVVECVEQRTRVDETKFLIDLEAINVAGVNKRRRSMLPKLISREGDDVNSSDVERDREGGDGDQSMEGSSSSMIIDDLPPLEKARRRKHMLKTALHL